MLLSKILQHLRRDVPKPAAPKPKPQASWATLKAGQQLVGLVSFRRPEGAILKGDRWEVREVDSLGATLTHLESGFRFRLDDRNWKGKLFERARKKKGT